MIEQLTGRPEPVVNAAVWGGLVSALIAFLRAMGWLELDNAQYDALMQFLNKFAKTVPKVNLLTFLLALERQIALNSRLSDVEIASLIRDGFFSMEEITKLSEKVKSIHFYRRLGLPLFCHACESKTFDLTTLRCVCGTRLYKDDDSFMAVLRVVH
jgi:hypothetical protein